ncbi:hypothetical protein [Motiliproteus sp. SC1-56]|uniref:hypothetical protein n=1 Tax=Motiliproteus sp. SC1-56 TaxID=2799565 RepID=UPI001A8EA1A9|nr:hypothetical protein [Motiliproteus sp. SC1-56]
MWLKKYLKPLVFILIALSVAVTWYINTQVSPDLTVAQKQRMDEWLVSQAPIKSHVWNFNRLAVGVVPQAVEAQAFAKSLCQKGAELNAQPESVAVVDVIKLQESGGENWQEIGFARCG